MGKHFLLAVCVCLMLSGCQLAREGEDVGQDRFVGVRLRVERVGAPDMDVPDQYPLEEPYFAFLSQGRGGDRSRGIGGDGAYFSQGRQHISVTDEGEEVAIQATVYLVGDDQFNQDVGDTALYFDSVYQRPDDSAYVVREHSGVSVNMDGFSTSRSDEWTNTMGGKATRQKFTCTVNIAQVNEMTGATLLSFDEDHALLSSQPIPVADHSVNLKVPPATAYAIVEKAVIDRYTRAPSIERTICNPPFDGQTQQCQLFRKGEWGIAQGYFLTLEQ